MKTLKQKCRVCLKPRTKLKDITDEHNLVVIPSINFEITLSQAFLQSTNILVTENDVAKLICNNCFERLKDSIKFKKDAEHSQIEINRLLNEGSWVMEENEVKKEYQSESGTEDYENPISPVEEVIKESLPILMIKDETEEDFLNKENVKIKNESQEMDDLDQDVLFNISTKRYKRVGRKENRTYVCETCGIQMDSKFKIVAHIRKSHIRGKLKKPCIKIDSQWVKKQLRMGYRFTCDFCKEEFKSYVLIARHLKRIHMSATPFGCNFKGCTQTFKTAVMRDTHYNRVHEGDRAMCEICGKDIKKHGMREHLNSHRTDRPFKCPYADCGDAFKDKNCLTQHIYCRHSDVKKYNCHICGNNFKLSTSLQAHIRRLHTFKNCLQCDVCQKWFLNANELQLHKNKIHLGLRPYACELCDASFKGRFHLNRHIRGSHPNDFAQMMEKGLLNIRKTSKYGKLPEEQKPQLQMIQPFPV